MARCLNPSCRSGSIPPLLNHLVFLGLEREFYAPVPPALSHPLLLHCSPETQAGQYEYALRPTRDIDALIAADEALIAHLRSDFSADFSAKPFTDKAGSGLHIHVHLEDEAGKALFTKQEDNLSDALRFAIGGLLAALPADMAIFAPTEASRLRFLHADFMTPTTLSWGMNNRTTALRLPDTGAAAKRIEHRVAGADVKAAPAIAAIISAIARGLEERIEPPPAVYGDASALQYALLKLIT